MRQRKRESKEERGRQRERERGRVRVMEYNKLIDIWIDEEKKKVVLQRIFRYGQEKAHVESMPI